MEKQLLIQASRGDEKAFRMLYNMYRSKIYSAARKITGIETVAEDIVQEVFLKLWIHREKMAEINYFTSYLNTITRNHIFNALRKMAHEDALLTKLLAKTEKTGRDSFDIIVYNQLQKLVNHAIERLPPQRKKVYLLSRSEGLAHDEIAERLHISKSTVKGHIVEALRFIKSYLHTHTDHALMILIAPTVIL